MSNKKTKLGKVVKSHNGYNVRIELKTVNITVKDRWDRDKIVGSRKSDNGTYGVYAGKKLVKGGFKTVDSAVSSLS